VTTAGSAAGIIAGGVTIGLAVMAAAALAIAL
jgi:hypothetical protein